MLRRSFPELTGPATSLYAAIPHLPLPDDDTVLASIRTPVQGHAREARLLGPDGSGARDVPVRHVGRLRPTPSPGG